MLFKDRCFDDVEPVLTVSNLEISLFNDTPVLNDVEIIVHKGETVCLVGESGSGKSVTALAVMGLLPRNALKIQGGLIKLEQQSLLELDQKAMRKIRSNRISMIFQEPMTSLNPLMTVGAQIEEILNVHTRLSAREKKQRVVNIMNQVRLPDVKRIYDSYPHQLSGGQRQRIMIAMALIMEPKLLIADEPTTALDVTTQRQVLDLIAELQEKHDTAVLFITHDMGVVAEIADTVFVMKDGHVVEQATVSAILQQPQMEYTRRLLKAVPSLVPRKPRAMAKCDSALTVEGLSKRYGRQGIFSSSKLALAADDVNLSLARGRTLGIVGESGSGKSTVARCILRLIDPTAGQIKLGKTDIAHLSRRQLRPHRRNIQIVFQDPMRSLNPRCTIAECLIEGPLNYDINRREALDDARGLLELVGLPPDALTRYPHQFSGGQRQRIAIARAIGMRPDVLVADEAVSALDVSVQAQVLQLLDEVQEKLGIAILFITHDLRVAAQICDHVIVMQNGRVVEYGTAEDVLFRPAHHYTQELIGSAAGRGWDFANFCELPRKSRTP